MTGMALQALAPYYQDDKYPKVKKAVDKTLDYLKKQKTENAGYLDGGKENSCTTAQVLTALAALKIDPMNADEGFTSNENNIVKNLHSYKTEDGFGWQDGKQTNGMAVQQVTYALEAYRRLVENKNSLYDITDTKPQTPDNESGHVVISVERFTIGQGYIYEPVFVPFEKGDNAATLLKKVIGKENFVGEDTYLEAIVGGDLGTDKVVVPEYIEKLSNGSVTTETAREWGDGGDALGEFDYSNYSGWMYHVNGEEVGYGIASYKPKDGDVLRFQFTMYGYGTDLTGRQWGNPNPIIDICNKDEITKLMAEVNADREKMMAVPEVKAAYDEAVKLVSAVITPKEEIDAAAAKLREAVENAQKVPNGWLETSEGWQYYENGQKVIGWLDTGNHWYYMDHNGIMKTGWVSVNGHWYYMDQWGAMVTGWVSVNGRWYYMDQWGAMMTGWVSVNGHWYYLSTDGSMAASQWIGDYYVQADGAMATSQWIGGYYVDTFGKWVRNA